MASYTACTRVRRANRVFNLALLYVILNLFKFINIRVYGKSYITITSLDRDRYSIVEWKTFYFLNLAVYATAENRG